MGKYYIVRDCKEALMKQWIGTALILTTSLVATAQQHKHPGAEKPATMNIPQPAPEMKKLAKLLVGTWKIDEHVLPSEMSPNGAKGKATEVIRIGPGSTSIVMDYKGSAMGNFAGHGLLSWSPDKKLYESVWVDSMIPGGIMMMTGNWEGENLVFTGNDGMANRHTYSNIKPDSFTYTLEMGPDAGKLAKVLVLEYKRSAGGAPRAKTPEPANQ
jgi:hypothetical protein